MYLLQSSISRLRQKEYSEDCQNHIRSEPDISIFGTPTELGRIDKIRRRECPQPISEKVCCSCEAEGYWSELVVWELAAY
jgi:hypothetical protein